jgi:hypothetical protein
VVVGVVVLVVSDVVVGGGVGPQGVFPPQAHRTAMPPGG